MRTAGGRGHADAGILYQLGRGLANRRGLSRVGRLSLPSSSSAFRSLRTVPSETSNAWANSKTRKPGCWRSISKRNWRRS